jgi:hypothetical protein
MNCQWDNNGRNRTCVVCGIRITMDDAGPIDRPVVSDCLGPKGEKARPARGSNVGEVPLTDDERVAVVRKLRDAFEVNKAAYGVIPEGRFQDCLECHALYRAGCKHVEASSCSERWVRWRIKVAEGKCGQFKKIEVK